MRFVKFFEGFLNLKIKKKDNDMPGHSYFQSVLRNYNSLSFNRVIEDMKSQMIDVHSVCLGPFDKNS